MSKSSPHKIRRTKRVYIRATPDTKAQLKEIKRHTGLNAADLLEEITLAKYAELRKKQHSKP